MTRPRSAAATVAALALVLMLTPSASAGSLATTAAVNCSDFSSQAAAQSYFVSLGGPAVDPEGLDADGDGVACESLPCPCGSGGPAPPPPPVIPPEAAAACGSNDPVGLRFFGLPSRLIIGKREILGVDDTIDAFISGKADVKMFDEAGRVFADVRLDPIVDEAWLRLDLGDRWATVTATAVEDHLDGSSCTRTISKRVNAITRIYAPSKCFDSRVRPRSIIVACGDGNLQLRKLRCRSWEGSVARAVGVALGERLSPVLRGGQVPPPADESQAVWAPAVPEHRPLRLHAAEPSHGGQAAARDLAADGCDFVPMPALRPWVNRAGTSPLDEHWDPLPESAG